MPRTKKSSAPGNAIAAEAEPAGYANLQGVGRAMAVLEQLAEGGMRPKELSQALGLKWTTLYRTLAYLHDRGYLERDEATGVYYVGARALLHRQLLRQPPAGAPGRSALPQGRRRRPRRHRPAVPALRSALARAPGSRAGGGSYIPKTTIGFHFPLHCGAKGQVLLAYSSPEQTEAYLAEPLLALTPHTVTDAGQLRERLEEIRASGYAVTRRDVQLSTAAAACPVMDASGQVIASVSLIVPHAEFARKEARLVDAASRTAQAISLLNGWRPEAGTHRAANDQAQAGDSRAPITARAGVPVGRAPVVRIATEPRGTIRAGR